MRIAKLGIDYADYGSPSERLQVSVWNRLNGRVRGLNLYGSRRFALHCDGDRCLFWEWTPCQESQQEPVTDSTLIALLDNWTPGACIDPLLDRLQEVHSRTADTIGEILNADQR